ncbi:hypothetical protein [Emticicia fontis]
MAETTKKYSYKLAYFLNSNEMLKYFYKISELAPEWEDFKRISDEELKKIGLKEEQIEKITETHKNFNLENIINNNTFLSKLLIYIGLLNLVSFSFFNFSKYGYLTGNDISIQKKWFEILSADCSKDWYFLFFYFLVFLSGIVSIIITFIHFSNIEAIKKDKFGKSEVFQLKLFNYFLVVLVFEFLILLLYFPFIIYASYDICEFDFFSINNVQCFIHVNGVGFIILFIGWLLFFTLFLYQYYEETKSKSILDYYFEIAKYAEKNSGKLSLSAIVLAIFSFLATMFGLLSDGYSTFQNVGLIGESTELEIVNIKFEKDSILLNLINKTNYPILINSANLALNDRRTISGQFIIHKETRDTILLDNYSGFGTNTQRKKSGTVSYKNKELKYFLDTLIRPNSNLKIFIDTQMNELLQNTAISFTSYNLFIDYNSSKKLNLEGIIQFIANDKIPQSFYHCRLYFFSKHLDKKILDDNSSVFLKSNATFCNCQ